MLSNILQDVPTALFLVAGIAAGCQVGQYEAQLRMTAAAPYMVQCRLLLSEHPAAQVASVVLGWVAAEPRLPCLEPLLRDLAAWFQSLVHRNRFSLLHPAVKGRMA